MWGRRYHHNSVPPGPTFGQASTSNGVATGNTSLCTLHSPLAALITTCFCDPPFSNGLASLANVLRFLP